MTYMGEAVKRSDVALVPLDVVLSDVVESLQSSAKDGNVAAVTALIDVQQEIRYTALVNNMDDDEFTP